MRVDLDGIDISGIDWVPVSGFAAALSAKTSISATLYGGGTPLTCTLSASTTQSANLYGSAAFISAVLTVITTQNAILYGSEYSLSAYLSALSSQQARLTFPNISNLVMSGNIKRSLAQKTVNARFTFAENAQSVIGGGNYFNQIVFFQPDYLGTLNAVFVGMFPTATQTPSEVGVEEETLTAYDFSWYLTMQYLPDNMIVMPYSSGASPGVMTPDVFIKGCLGDTLAMNPSTFVWYTTDNNWSKTTKINPLYINAPSWSGASSPAATQFTFTTQMTKSQAIEKLCNYLGWIFYVRWLNISGTWTPCAWFVDQAKIDLTSASGGLGLPAMVNLTNPRTGSPSAGDLCYYLDTDSLGVTVQGDDQYNFAIIRYKAGASANWSQVVEYAAGVYHPVYNPTGTVPRIEYYEESSSINNSTDATARATNVLSYYGSGIVTWKMTFDLRSDLQLLQKVNVSGYSAAIQGGIPDGVYRIIDIEYNYDQAQSVNSVTVSLIANSQFQMFLGLNKIFLNDVYEQQNVAASVADQTSAPIVGTVLSRSGNVLTVQVIQHDSTVTTVTAKDATGSINSGTVTLVPDGTGNFVATQGITAATISGTTITIDGVSGIIESSNFVAGSVGFAIKGDGSAEFNNVTVRGTIATSVIGSGSTVTVNGTIQSSNYVPFVSGWILYGSGAAEIASLYCQNVHATYEIVAPWYRFVSTTGNPKLIISSDGANLYFIDGSNVSHTLV